MHFQLILLELSSTCLWCTQYHVIWMTFQFVNTRILTLLLECLCWRLQYRSSRWIKSVGNALYIEFPNYNLNQHRYMVSLTAIYINLNLKSHTLALITPMRLDSKVVTEPLTTQSESLVKHMRKPFAGVSCVHMLPWYCIVSQWYTKEALKHQRKHLSVHKAWVNRLYKQNTRHSVNSYYYAGQCTEMLCTISMQLFTIATSNKTPHTCIPASTPSQTPSKVEDKPVRHCFVDVFRIWKPSGTSNTLAALGAIQLGLWVSKSHRHLQHSD